MKGTLLALRRYPEALQRNCWSALWELFDGNPERFNIAHECVDRHPPADSALRIWRADGGRDERGEVTLELGAVNQRDETIAIGEAVVVLPRRRGPHA